MVKITGKPATLIWRSDPGHAWLIVSRAQLSAAGLSANDISQLTCQRGDLIALEEDGDAGLYINARYAPEEIAALRHDEREVTGRDLPRNWMAFGAKPVSPHPHPVGTSSP